MAELTATLAIGLLAGVLSGAFGIGGGVIMVPAMRILLDVPALIAVGSSLPVIVPGALVGASSYLRSGQSDWRTGLIVGAAGVPVAAGGAWLAEKLGGTIVLVTLGAVILYAAADTLIAVWRPRKRADGDAGDSSPPASLAAGIGAITGFYSGFLGLGGGFIIVPLLTRFGHVPIKRAIGTSLVAIVLIAIPGTLTHLALGNTDLWLSAALALGVVPGALLGSRITLGTNERAVRAAFAAMLLLTGALLVTREVGLL